MKMSQRGFLAKDHAKEGVSGPYIAAVESGKSKVSPDLSTLLINRYGAWLEPGRDTADVYEAFGDTWEQNLHIIRASMKGPIFFADEYSSDSELRAAIEVKQQELARLKSVQNIRVFPGNAPRFNEYTEDSFQKFKLKPRTDPFSLDDIDHLPQRSSEHEKFHEVIKLIAEISPSDLGKIVAAVDSVIDGADSELKKKLIHLYEERRTGVSKVFPWYREGFKEQYLENAAEVQQKGRSRKSRGFINQDSFIDGLTTPESFKNYGEFGKYGIEAEKWLELQEAVCEAKEDDTA